VAVEEGTYELMPLDSDREPLMAEPWKISGQKFNLNDVIIWVPDKPMSTDEARTAWNILAKHDALGRNLIIFPCGSAFFTVKKVKGE
jgi:hypothetical protein